MFVRGPVPNVPQVNPDATGLDGIIEQALSEIPREDSGEQSQDIEPDGVLPPG
jgi:hypothetical protein